MIGVACPGCGETYSVEDAKSGKATRCKRCRTKFIVPFPERPPAPQPVPGGDFELTAPPLSSAPPHPAPAPAPPAVADEWSTPPTGTPRPPAPVPPPAAGVDIAPCPGCQARLTVTQAD